MEGRRERKKVPLYERSLPSHISLSEVHPEFIHPECIFIVSGFSLWFYFSSRNIQFRVRAVQGPPWCSIIHDSWDRLPKTRMTTEVWDLSHLEIESHSRYSQVRVRSPYRSLLGKVLPLLYPLRFVCTRACLLYTSDAADEMD